MRAMIWIAALAGIVALAAWLTRPGLDDFDMLLKEQIADKVAHSDIGTEGDAIATLALVGCKLRPSDCFTVIRQSLDIVIEDKRLYTRVTVKGLGKTATCTGAFTRFWCSKGLMDG